jgi:hypothetical protein
VAWLLLGRGAAPDDDAADGAGRPAATRPPPPPAGGPPLVGSGVGEPPPDDGKEKDPAAAIEGRIRPPAATPPDAVLPAKGIRVRAVPVRGGTPSPWVATDGDGRFRIDDLAPVPHRLVAKTGPFAEELVVAASAVPGAPPADHDLVPARRAADAVPRGVGGRVRLLGHDGAAVATAHVAAHVAGVFHGYIDVRGGEFARAAAEPWGTTYEISAARDADGRPLPYGPLVVGLDDGESPVVTVRLPPERVVEGRLVGPSGAGVPDVEVRVMALGSFARPPIATARTDRGGNFRLGGLGAGPYEIRTEGALPLYPPGRWTLEPHDTFLDLPLAGGSSVTLTLTDPTGRAVEGASLTLFRAGAAGSPDIVSARSGSAGEARIEGLDPEARYTLNVQPPPDRRDLRPIQRTGWLPTNAALTFERGFTVTGTLRDASGAPSRGFVQRKTPEGVFRPAVAVPADGRFEIRGLPEGPVTLAASASVNSPTGPEVTVDAGAIAVDLRLP